MRSRKKNGLGGLSFRIILSFLLIFGNFVWTAEIADNLNVAAVAQAAVSISTPTASLSTGKYFGAQKITLSCTTKGVTIYYTTDGTKPSTKSTKYTKTITKKKSGYIRAIAVKGNYKSKELTNYYKIYYDYKLITDDVERYQKAIENNKVSSLTKTDQTVCNKITKLISKYITSDMTAYDKVKWVHDYIINHTAYDVENYNAGTIPEDSYTIKGVIIDGVAVCQGYAETFQLFMNLLDIDNQMITGYASGGSHAWNLVKVEKAWYQVDTTWDDPISSTGEQTIQYQYFLINDEQMGLDHAWVTGNYPACTSDKLTYKIYEGYIIASVSNYEEKFTELYNSGLKTITILYPEYSLPDMDFYYNLTGKTKYSYYNPVQFGKYYIFTVKIE